MKSLAETFHLDKRVKLLSLGENHVAIEKLIKSRIISKDAQKIVEIAQQIINTDKKMKVSLICNDNICSKSVALLTQHNIEIFLDNLK